MWCDWYDRGSCSAPPYHVVGFTDGHYIVFCNAHAKNALDRGAEYIAHFPGVDYDEEADTNAGTSKFKQQDLIEQHADLY